MQDYCKMMNSMSGQNAGANQSAGQVCYSNFNTCQESCGNLVQKYQTLIGNCSGCESKQIYEQTLNELESKVRACDGLSSNLQAMGNQGMNSMATSGSANACQNMTSAAPQNAGAGGGGSGGSGAGGASPNGTGSPDQFSGGANPNDPYGCQSNPGGAGCQQCSSNPNSPACRALAYEKEVRGEASFNAGKQSADSKKDGSGFDLPDPQASSAYRGNGEPGAASAGAKNGTIANNSGGGIPGGGGGAPAKMDSKGGGGSPGAPGYTTDVLQGFSGAGGYSAAGGVDAGTDGDESGGFGGYGKGNRTPATDENGVDLRRFLPGGDRHPTRSRSGGIDIYSAQINGKFVNIWNRISERMQEKCRLGHLIGCDK